MKLSDTEEMNSSAILGGRFIVNLNEFEVIAGIWRIIQKIISD